MRETVDLCNQAGLKDVAYVPLNHPFMDTTSKDPRYADWSKKFADGTPMTTEHYGFAEYFEGCLNSPVRDVIRALVREVLTQYPVRRDVLRRSLPGHEATPRITATANIARRPTRRSSASPCPTRTKVTAKTRSSTPTGWPTMWTIAFLREIREMIRTDARRARAVQRHVAAQPARVAQPRHPGGGRLHVRSRRNARRQAVQYAAGPVHRQGDLDIRGHPHRIQPRAHEGRSRARLVQLSGGEPGTADGWRHRHGRRRGNRLLGTVALLLQPQGPLAYESGRYVKEIFDFQQKHDALLRSVEAARRRASWWATRPSTGIAGKHFVSKGYENCFHGAYQVLKGQRLRSRAVPGLADDARAAREIPDDLCAERGLPQRCAMRHAARLCAQRRQAAGHAPDIGGRRVRPRAQELRTRGSVRRGVRWMRSRWRSPTSI